MDEMRSHLHLSALNILKKYEGTTLHLQGVDCFSVYAVKKNYENGRLKELENARRIKCG